jgi:hypothetical protein
VRILRIANLSKRLRLTRLTTMPRPWKGNKLHQIAATMSHAVNYTARRVGLARFQSFILAFIATVLVAGCGGGNGTPNTTSTTTTTTTTTALASSLQLLAGSPTIDSSGSTTVSMTAVVLDTNNNQLSNQPITFQVIDPVTNPAFVSNISGVGTGGTSSSTTSGPATATLNLGANKTNRTITVVASVIPAVGASAITASVSVAVAGTVIATPAGGSSLVFGATLPLTTSLKDSAGVPIAGQVLTIHSSAGNTITPATATTDLAGSISFSVTGTKTGTDVITVTGLGATSQPLTLTVSNSNFVFASPAPNTFVSINTNQTITLHWDTGGVPQVGQPVQFNSTRGTLSATTVNTDANGNASVSITSPGTGQATIAATGVNGTPAPAAILNIVFGTSTANKVSVQSGRAALPINVFNSLGVAQTTSQTPIIAIVRDVNNNLVQGATVNFQIVTDPSGGSLDASSSVTNISGSTSVNYIAGTTSSGSNTVQVSATVVSVNGTPVTGTVQAFVNLTVAGQSLFIRMQTDNQLAAGTGIYTKSYFALVTDSAGNPVSSTTNPITVTFAVAPTNYMTGTSIPNGLQANDLVTGGGVTQCEPAGAPCPGAYQKGQWIQLTSTWAKVAGAPTPQGTPAIYYDCLNEDTNFNGILDAGEDYNADGRLTPGNVASVNATAPTNPSGIAQADVTYVKGFATWAAVNLTATITVSGTEYIQSIPFVLPILAGDIANVSIPPPGQISPFGLNVCNNPR